MAWEKENNRLEAIAIEIRELQKASDALPGNTQRAFKFIDEHWKLENEEQHIRIKMSEAKARERIMSIMSTELYEKEECCQCHQGQNHVYKM